MTDRASAASVRWRYRAADSRGVASSGEVEAPSEREAVDALRRRNLWVTELAPVDAPNVAPLANDSRPSAIPWRWRNRGASTADLAVIMRAMATLLSAGVPLDRALAYAATQAVGDEAKGAFAAVRDAVRNGQALSTAIARHSIFPAVFAPTLAASEVSGSLDASLTLLADQLERLDATRSRLQAALIYPAILAFASIIGVSVILLLVVPRFAVLIADSGGALPMSTRVLVALSTMLARWWWWLLLGTVVTAAAWRRWQRNDGQRARWHAQRLTWPVLGTLERLQASAAYTGTLSVALRSGVTLLAAMSLSRGVVRNVALASELERAEGRVRDGGTLAAAMERVLPPLAVRLLDAGEVSGDLAGMAGRAADGADAAVQRAVARAVLLVEPIMILGFGGVVGFVALALLQAIYGVNARTL